MQIPQLKKPTTEASVATQGLAFFLEFSGVEGDPKIMGSLFKKFLEQEAAPVFISLLTLSPLQENTGLSAFFKEKMGALQNKKF